MFHTAPPAMLRHTSLVLSLMLVVQLAACAQEHHTVTRVVDGDTFVIETGERVRLLGVDTPEKWESAKLDRDAERTGHDRKLIQALGEKASAFAKALVEGKRVRLEGDPINSDKDKYGRLLRYVYLEDGTFVNMTLVREGYANAYTRFPLTKTDEFLAAQRDAREHRRGLWADDVFANDAPAQAPAAAPAPAPAVAPQKATGKYWINSSSMTRHNSGCKYFGKTRNGWFTDTPEGKACSQCGG